MKPGNDTSLVFGERGSSEPGTHVLLVGVSSYPFLRNGEAYQANDQLFDIGQLTASVLSAQLLREWLIANNLNLVQPLKTVRLLASPSVAELAEHPDLENHAARAKYKNFCQAVRNWREDASANADNTTIFYFAGHGFQRANSALLLLEDFLEPDLAELAHAIDAKSIVDAMAPCPERPKIARSQIYLFDSCRSYPARFSEYSANYLDRIGPFLEQVLPIADKRDLLTVFACGDFELAHATPRTATAFVTALLKCLDCDAGDQARSDDVKSRWHVTASTLGDALRSHFAKSNSTNQIPDYQLNKASRSGPDGFVVRYFKTPPAADIELHLKPEQHATHCTVTLTRQQDQANLLSRVMFGSENPRIINSEAGMHHANLEPADTETPLTVSRLIRPPSTPWTVQIGTLQDE